MAWLVCVVLLAGPLAWTQRGDAGDGAGSGGGQGAAGGDAKEEAAAEDLIDDAAARRRRNRRRSRRPRRRPSRPQGGTRPAEREASRARPTETSLFSEALAGPRLVLHHQLPDPLVLLRGPDGDEPADRPARKRLSHRRWSTDSKSTWTRNSIRRPTNWPRVTIRTSDRCSPPDCPNSRPGYPQAIEAMQEVGEEENMKMDHRLSYMALIGTISPMVGLFGTVDGMIRSFSVIAHVGRHAASVRVGQRCGHRAVDHAGRIGHRHSGRGGRSASSRTVIDRLVLEVGIISERSDVPLRKRRPAQEVSSSVATGRIVMRFPT